MYIVENDKKFWDNGNGSYTRSHDKEFTGARFEYRRCPFCSRLTCSHTLHWLNHLDKCAPPEYSNKDLLDLRYKGIEKLQGHRVPRKQINAKHY